MSEAGFSATVTISTNESGDTSVSLVASEPVVASVAQRFASEEGESETVVDIVPPDVSETHFDIDEDDGEGDELVLTIVGEDDDEAEDDLPLAAEGEANVLPH